jgi:hypothetical protein
VQADPGAQGTITGVPTGHSYPAEQLGIVPESTVANVPAAQNLPTGQMIVFAVVGVKL